MSAPKTGEFLQKAVAAGLLRKYSLKEYLAKHENKTPEEIAAFIAAVEAEKPKE
jgi:hypothetical protein